MNLSAWRNGFNKMVLKLMRSYFFIEHRSARRVNREAGSQATALPETVLSVARFLLYEEWWGDIFGVLSSEWQLEPCMGIGAEHIVGRVFHSTTSYYGLCRIHSIFINYVSLQPCIGLYLLISPTPLAGPPPETRPNRLVRSVAG